MTNLVRVSVAIDTTGVEDRARPLGLQETSAIASASLSSLRSVAGPPEGRPDALQEGLATSVRGCCRVESRIATRTEALLAGRVAESEEEHGDDGVKCHRPAKTEGRGLPRCARRP